MSIDAPSAAPQSAPAHRAPVARRPHAALRSTLILVGAVAAAMTFAVVGAIVVAFAREPWFDNLKQPSWAPEAWMYVAGSLVVHLLTGLAGWRIGLRAPGSPLVTLWVVLLGLGLGWTVLFFGLWVPRWAMLEACVLAIVAIASVVATWPASRAASALLLPYVAWAALVMTLNAAILGLN
jgi:tryptophan-rich sensory protein